MESGHLDIDERPAEGKGNWPWRRVVTLLHKTSNSRNLGSLVPNVKANQEGNQSDVLDFIPMMRVLCFPTKRSPPL